MIFPLILYGCESWTIKKGEHWRIDAFELWYWRRLLRVPWTARRSNQSILKEISPGCSFEGLMLRLKLQYFGHLMQRVTHWKRPWCWEELQAGEKGTIEDEKDGWHHRLDAHEFGWRLEVSDGQGGLAFCGSWGCKELDMTERLNWTDNTSVVFSKHYWTDSFLSFSGVSSDKESTCHWRRCKIHGFDPWVGKIWRRKWQRISVVRKIPWTEEDWWATVYGLQRVWCN